MHLNVQRKVTIICDTGCVAVDIAIADIKVTQVKQEWAWHGLRLTMAAKDDRVVHTGIYNSARVGTHAGNAQQEHQQQHLHL